MTEVPNTTSSENPVLPVSKDPAKGLLCYSLVMFLKEAERRGMPRAAALEGIPYPESHLFNNLEWMDWDSCRRFWKNLGHHFDEKELIDIGFRADMSATKSTRIIMAANALFSSIRDFYWWSAGPDGMVHKACHCFKTLLLDLGEGHLVLEWTMKEGYPLCREAMVVHLGFLRRYPLIMGCEDPADISMEEIPGGMRYDIRFQERRGALYWVKRAILWPVRRHRVDSILQQAYEDIQTRYVELKAEVENRKAAEKQRAALQEQLAQSQRLETVGTLARGIAHDYNNLLQSTLAHASVLRKGVDGNETNRFHVDRILRSVDKAAALSKQLSTFARQDGTAREPVNLANVISDALPLLRSAAPSPIKIQSGAENGPGLILADPTQMDQIVMNLGLNALQAMEEDGGTLKLDVAQVELPAGEAEAIADLAPGAYCRLTVSDTGHGMDEATRTRIFEPFFTTKEPGKGTGLGLSVVHGIVQSHGGAIIVESAPGQGCVCHVYFPVAEVEAVQRAATPAEVPNGSERVLYVDDDQEVALAMECMLASIGYEVTAINDSYQALERVKDDPASFDILITDQVMAGLDGKGLIEGLREVHHEMPVLVVTAYNDSITIADREKLDIGAVLSKPITLHALATAIRNALDRRIKAH